MVKKILIGLAIVLVIIVLGNIILPVDQAAIEIAAEPIATVGPVELTNSLFTSILLSIALLLFAFYVGRNLKEKPGGLQNLVEFVIESLDGLVSNIAPKKWVPIFFPYLATIFIYLLFANWLSLFTPFFGAFGLVHLTDHNGIPVEGEYYGIPRLVLLTGNKDTLTYLHHEGEGEETHQEPSEAEQHAEQEAMIVPLLRAPSSDLNLTLALAALTMILVQVFGAWERGFFSHLGHFIRLDAFSKKGLGMGFIDFFVGLLEGISEVAKIISFSFRLFGNIFAGEVVLIVISSLVSLLLLLVFFGLEIFVGLIQAFIFFILSLVFFSTATQHGGEEH